MAEKRQLRSSTTAAALSSGDSTMPTKKRKTAAPKYLCLTCQTERTSGSFPDYNASASCEHLIHTCKACLKKWVEVQVESSEFVKRSGVAEVAEGAENAGTEKEGATDDKKDSKKEGEEGTECLLFGIKCPHPDCKGVMRNVNVQDAATKKVYQQFVEFERKFIGDATPGWRWCLASDCKAGQVHAPLLHKQKHAQQAATKPPAKRGKKGKGKKKDPIVIYEDAAADVSDICTCNSCGAQACCGCDRPYHEGETCIQFQVRTKDRLEEEDKARREIEKATKACPGCKKRIQKNGGCPYMNCSQCGSAFCWNCASLFEQGRWCQCAHNRMPPVQQQAAAV